MLKLLLIRRDSVWSVLTGSASESTSSIVIHDVKEIETWILRLLSAPVPIPNVCRVEVNFCIQKKFHISNGGRDFHSFLIFSFHELPFCGNDTRRLRFFLQPCIHLYSLLSPIILDLHLLIFHSIYP